MDNKYNVHVAYTCMYAVNILSTLYRLDSRGRMNLLPIVSHKSFTLGSKRDLDRMGPSTPLNWMESTALLNEFMTFCLVMEM